MTHDNLVPLLGVSTAFGKIPAVITSWMTNGTHELAVFAFLQREPFAIGFLSEYIKSREEYDKMELAIGVARGVAYLHCRSYPCSCAMQLVILVSYSLAENIVHSDIRGVCSFGTHDVEMNADFHISQVF